MSWWKNLLGRARRILTYGTRTAASPASPGRPLLMLYDYRAREYDPWHGRFCQRDPAEYAESLNLYQYALSNPTTWSDPGRIVTAFDLNYLLGSFDYYGS